MEVKTPLERLYSLSEDDILKLFRDYIHYEHNNLDVVKNIKNGLPVIEIGYYINYSNSSNFIRLASSHSEKFDLFLVYNSNFISLSITQLLRKEKIKKLI